MKLKVLQSGEILDTVEGSQITKHFALYDDFTKGRRTYKISHIPTGRTICRRKFASSDVAETLCQLFEEAFGNILDQNINGIIGKDLAENVTVNKTIAHEISILLEEMDNPITFSKFTKAKKQAHKELGMLSK